MKIDSSLPGGNVVVKQIDGNNVTLNRELRDTPHHWIYWKFRAVFDSTEPACFRFDDGYALTARGPAISHDKGRTWAWGNDFNLKEESFTYTPHAAGEEVWFCQCIPYMETDLHAFLDDIPKGSITVSELCKSRKGRSVELLKLGNGPRKIFLSSRHHCQESMATYALEGILREVLDNPQDYVDFTFLAVPFVDKDGVEDGDQGKGRAPHDHARDYGPNAIYPEVRANMELIMREQPVFIFDLHCPWVRSGDSEHVYFVGQKNQRIQAGIDRFSSMLSNEAPADFPTSPEDDIPFGTLWNNAQNYSQGKPIVPWAADLPWQPAAQSMEIPFANTHDITVNADSARHLGAALARTIRKFLCTNK